jgi:hypothetical protein
MPPTHESDGVLNVQRPVFNEKMAGSRPLNIEH